jgi:hypothetical protein
MRSSPASEPPEVLDRGPGYLFGVYRNVFVAFWFRQATAALLDRMVAVQEPRLPQHPTGFSNVHVVAKGTPLAGSEARDRMANLLRKYSNEFAAVGAVLEGQGFWASATRSLILGVRLLAPRTFDLQIYESIEELANWLPAPREKKTGVALEVAELARALRELREQVPTYDAG